MRKTISLLAVAIVALLASFSASARDLNKCGDNLEYKLYRSANNKARYTLEISGTGDMYDFETIVGCTPWEKKNLLEKINKVIIHEGVTSIGAFAFISCVNLTSVSLPNSLTKIGRCAFCCCFGIKSLTLPNSIVCIGNDAFEGCRGLTSITLPNSLIALGGWAFRDCKNLSSITLPKSLTTIGGGVFIGCKRLKVINSLSEAAPNCVEYIGCADLFGDTLKDDAASYSRCQLNVPAGAEVSYKYDPIWGRFYRAKKNSSSSKKRATQQRRGNRRSR
mgnify:CR=1 FL=1